MKVAGFGAEILNPDLQDVKQDFYELSCDVENSKRANDM